MKRVSFVLLCCAAVLPLSVRAQQTAFTSRVYPILQKANCRACHVDGGLAGSTRLHFPPADATSAQIEDFGRSLAVLADRAAPEKSLLILKPTNRLKHTGGQLVKPGGAEEAVLLEWVRYLATTELPSTISRNNKAVTRPSLRRLTHSQYNNVVRDLLGDDTRPADRFPPEDYVNGYKNQIASQDISPVLAEAYNTAAERLAKATFQSGTDDHHLIPCTPRSHDDAQCRSEFVRVFGLRAFRRPVTAAEQSRYELVFRKAADASRSFTAGAQLVVEAMLQSPKFLFQTNQDRAYAVASRLSLFLWDTMPDEGLLRSAAAGELLKPGGLDTAVNRMVHDPRASQGLNEFVSQWLRFDLALGAVRDRALYPQFTPELAAAMAEESRLLISDIVSHDRNFMDVFTAGYAFVNSDLAAVYGLPAPASEFARVSFPAESDRAGLLGQAVFLALTSKPGETSPTVRGYFVREHFLCQQVPDPPPGTNANLPPLTEAKPQTSRERLIEHTINQTCRGCHGLMDPVGFGLERFDAIGRRREKQKIVFMPEHAERNKKPVTVELPLDARGEVEGVPDSAFSSPKELGALLARTPACQECVVRQLFRYAFGRNETSGDREIIDSATVMFRESNFRMTALMAHLAKTLALEEEAK